LPLPGAQLTHRYVVISVVSPAGVVKSATNTGAA
jgi:hypothetical protein